nr:MAG TPA: hypothetical protein [Bacteriophage sp.]DAZ74733.1 MAG TPA: hypothetical protein [Caudoviricetes sp.]
MTSLACAISQIALKIWNTTFVMDFILCLFNC